MSTSETIQGSSQAAGRVTADEVCVLGLGVTGMAVARHYLSLPEPPKLGVYVDTASERNLANIRLLADEFFGGEVPDSLGKTRWVSMQSGQLSLSVYIGLTELEQHYGLGVASPGIKPTNQLYISAEANCDELISEPELAYRLSPQRWLAVTGTNGKTTTTWLVDHLLASGGLGSQVAGNVGPTLIDAANQRAEGGWLVVELSSYQLATSTSLAPQAAILLNITPDHLSWHGSFEAYRQAKMKVFEHLPPGAPAVIDGTSQVCREVIAECMADGRRVVAVGLSPAEAQACFSPEAPSELAWVDDGRLCVRLAGHDHQLIAVGDMKIKGLHNCLNALAASTVALHVGVPDADVIAGLASFEPLEHRIEPAGEVDGVGFYNDSKATNPEATLMALSAFEPGSMLVLLGGDDKLTPLEELADAVLRSCRVAICYGEAGERFYDALAEAKTRLAGSAEAEACYIVMQLGCRSAFETAVELARPGDVVLLSPACASFDEFDDFEHRGAEFKQWVADLAKAAGGAASAGQGTAR